MNFLNSSGLCAIFYLLTLWAASPFGVADEFMSAPSSSRLLNAVIDPQTRYQRIDGFGASLAYTAQNIPEDQADLFFDANRGLGLSLARIRINFRKTDESGNVRPNSWEWRSALKAQERGAAVWASPWSANGRLKEGNTSGEFDHKGGRLKQDASGTYAQNLVEFVQWAAGQGIHLAAISPQNEPDYRFHNNESMDWEPTELYAFIRDHLRPALIWAKHIHQVIVEASGNAWNWWWILPPAHGRNNNETLVTVSEDGTLHVLKRGWMIGQFSRFIRPGYQRVHLEPQTAGDLRLAGFAGDERLVVVAIHEGLEDQPFRLEGLPPDLGRVRAWITSETENLTQKGQIPITGPTLDMILPAQSIITLVIE